MVVEPNIADATACQAACKAKGAYRCYGYEWYSTNNSCKIVTDKIPVEATPVLAGAICKSWNRSSGGSTTDIKLAIDDPTSVTTPKAKKLIAPEINDSFLKTAKECFDLAKVKQSGCNFFMFSTDYPVEGCYCCDTYEPEDDKGPLSKAYDIYQTCVPTKLDTSNAAAVKADKKKETDNNGGEHQQCFNKVNLNAHNQYRLKHKSPALTFDESLARLAQAHASTLKLSGQLASASPQQLEWKGKSGKTCGESLLKLPATTDDEQRNLAASALVSDTFYKGYHAYDFSKHRVITDKGVEQELKGKEYA